jgi:hypothetical protein
MAKLIPLKSYEEKINSVEIQFGEKKGVAVTSFIGWEKLQKLLKQVQELKVNDKFNKVIINENGIQYYLE